jgi:RNA polymerase sigma-70 factor (ECF subfamily)
MRRVGTYQLQAAIASLHDAALTADETDWPQIAALYRVLGEMVPSAVVELNRAVAVAMADGPTAGLVLIDRLVASGDLAGYPYLHAARADLLRRLDRRADAAASYRIALDLTANGAEREFLEGRLRGLGRVTG